MNLLYSKVTDYITVYVFRMWIIVTYCDLPCKGVFLFLFFFVISTVKVLLSMNKVKSELTVNHLFSQYCI